MLQPKIEKEKRLQCINNSCRDNLIKEYKSYIKIVENISNHLINLIEKASSKDINVFFQILSIQERSIFQYQVEISVTELMTRIIDSILNNSVEFGFDQIISQGCFWIWLKEIPPLIMDKWSVHKLIGLNCDIIQHEQENNKRNCLKGSIINFKLKLISFLRKEYFYQYQNFKISKTGEKMHSNIA